MQVLLEQGSISSVAERMKDYQVIAMLVLLGLVLRHGFNFNLFLPYPSCIMILHFTYFFDLDK